MLTWFRTWWQEVTAEQLFWAAVLSFLITGVYSCAVMPPQPVMNRFRTRHRVEHSECLATDSKGNCTNTHTWTTIEPLWVLVDPDGRECEVLSVTYERIRPEELKKCYQLFGWRQGVWDHEFPIEQQGWR